MGEFRGAAGGAAARASATRRSTLRLPGVGMTTATQPWRQCPCAPRTARLRPDSFPFGGAAPVVTRAVAPRVRAWRATWLRLVQAVTAVALPVAGRARVAVLRSDSRGAPPQSANKGRRRSHPRPVSPRTTARVAARMRRGRALVSRQSCGIAAVAAIFSSHITGRAFGPIALCRHDGRRVGTLLYMSPRGHLTLQSRKTLVSSLLKAFRRLAT